MDYGQLLSRTWNLIWEYKFLILLGVLVALGGGTSTDFNIDLSRGRSTQINLPEEFNWGDFEGEFDFDRDLNIPNFVPALVIPTFLFGLLIAFALWVLATIARGGLIAGASALDAGLSSNFSAAWSAGWQKGWRLLGISLLPAIPTFFTFLLGIISFVGVAGIYALLGEGFATPIGVGLVPVLIGATCVLFPIALILGLLATFAYRACMFEDLGVFASYRRGFNVLIENIGEVVVLFLIQVGIGIVLGFLLLIPSICCLLWPVLLVVRGAIAAYFSTLWTLAWRRWTEVITPPEGVEPMAAL
ncbi:MAG: hypothetical protein ACLFU8_15165 [Anaerolineales bacterium]